MHPFYYRLKEISVFCVLNIVADYLSVAHWRKCVRDNGKDDKSKKCLRDSDFVFFFYINQMSLSIRGSLFSCYLYSTLVWKAGKRLLQYTKSLCCV